ncbi:MAG: hypothetical protein OEV34_05760 [Gammaproteobacteria bacterium]|nr:hypothetical protein [Gammaproteobacteria bacterium]
MIVAAKSCQFVSHIVSLHRLQYHYAPALPFIPVLWQPRSAMGDGAANLVALAAVAKAPTGHAGAASSLMCMLIDVLK